MWTDRPKKVKSLPNGRDLTGVEINIIVIILIQGGLVMDDCYKFFWYARKGMQTMVAIRGLRINPRRDCEYDALSRLRIQLWRITCVLRSLPELHIMWTPQWGALGAKHE